ncbi:MAG TPA: hypothetical protein VFV10_17955, partial [Gammaproteobacteria bacterium]|nr:hypothetical protein [Gammaproteobacteria bacterium]
IGNEILARDAGTTNVGLVSIERNTGLRLSTIAMGSIAGNLAITGNTGFSDDDARAFAAARNVAGTVTISGNQP